MWQHIMYCFQCRRYVDWLSQSTYLLHWKQRTHIYVIRCHVTHNNGILIILTRNFSWELYVLLDDNMRCTIETCRSSESVSV